MSLSHEAELKNACITCLNRKPGFLCSLSQEAFVGFASIKHPLHYSVGDLLFLEKEDAQGVYVVCSGQIKLSFSSSMGKTLTLRIAKPGDLLGLTSTMSGTPHEVTAEVLQPCQVAFIRRSDFLHFIEKHPGAYAAVISQMSAQYKSACEQLRTVALSSSANEKLARLLLEWASEGTETQEGTQIRMPWTHEQIAECVGSTWETVSRTLGDFKIRRLISIKGATMVIPNRAALAAVCG